MQSSTIYLVDRIQKANFATEACDWDEKAMGILCVRMCCDPKNNFDPICYMLKICLAEAHNNRFIDNIWLFIV